MKPVKDDKIDQQAAPNGTTTEDGSNEVTPEAAAPMTAGPLPNPGLATEPAIVRAATEPDTVGAPTDPATAGAATGPETAEAATEPDPARRYFGISMVHGPPITLDLDLTVEPSTSSRASSRTPSARLRPPANLLAENTHAPDVHSTSTRSRSVKINPYRSNVNYHASSTGGTYFSSTLSNQPELAISSSIASISTLDEEVKHYIKRRETAIYDYYPGTERVEYDYVAERNDLYTTNVLESTAHLIKGSLGGAVLSMHEAYMIGGLWTSLIVTVAVGCLTAYTTFMLIRSAQKLYRRLRINKLSYPDLAEAAAATAPWHWVRNRSKVFRYTVEITLILQMVGNCCVYQIVIAKTMKMLMVYLEPSILTWVYDIRMYILISAPLLLPLCLIRSLKWLSPFAVLADIFVALCVMTTMYYSALAFVNTNILSRAAWKDIHGFIRVCGICLYGTSGICVALPVENNMRSPKYFPLVVRNATFIVTLLTGITGFFGYWAWGETCTSPITTHMSRNIITTVLQFLLLMMLSITFAISLWVPFRIVWHYVIRKRNRRYIFWERVSRFIMTILVTGLSMLAPHTITVMIFMGQFLLGFTALVFPAIIEFVVDWEDHYASRDRVNFVNNAKNFVIVILGLTLSLSTTYTVRDK